MTPAASSPCLHEAMVPHTFLDRIVSPSFILCVLKAGYPRKDLGLPLPSHFLCALDWASRSWERLLGWHTACTAPGEPDARSWPGVTIAFNTIVEIRLRARGLAGHLELSLFNITTLVELDLSWNALEGSPYPI